ncbi:alpha/beta fold hydrolase [Bradyrhizobium sp. NAS80.1]|uniref:alpha/beta fold hydrolase n=1 Tax=Bradyrhizobium sp. NAS80.1 TaxID=1680159 RepID=UPI001FDA8DC7|nr:alpha/beta fold hydrolase [Bradyrhizobium sp. NAS80.1]
MTHDRTADFPGLKIVYREAGNANHPTILLLHGFPASSFMFRELIDQLADQFHLVAPDYAGFDYSSAPSSKEFFLHLRPPGPHCGEVHGQTRTQNIRYMNDFGGPVGFRLPATRKGLVPDRPERERARRELAGQFLGAGEGAVE